MKMRNAALGALSIVCLVLGTANAQEKKKAPAPGAKKAAAPAAAPQGMPPLPKPGPEHEVLKGEVGTWDATVESWEKPGAPPTVSKGVETNTLMDGMWLVTDFKGEFMNIPFNGHGVAGYDSGKKKYVSTWVDSMSTGLSIGESTYDAKTKTMTGWMEGPDMTGKVTKSKAVNQTKDANTRTFTMAMTGPDGKEFTNMKITYKRKK